MKTVLITGSTDGIGKLAATKIAKEGHQVLLHGRNGEKLERTISEVQSLSGNPNIKGFLSDLSDFSSIQNMVTEVAREFSKLDVLINNAGIFHSNIETNQDGYDIRFAVNYFAPVILTNGLLPLLKESLSARIINLSSAAQATVSLNVLAGKEALSAQVGYAQSKLALTMWSFYYSQKHDFINVIALNPGSLLNTKMVQEAYGQFWSSADKGASIIYELALLEKFEDSSGKYYDNDKGGFNNAHSDAYNSEKVESLISETEKLLHL